MKKIPVLIIIFLLLFFVVRGWWNSQLAPAGSDKGLKTVIIAKGSGLNEIANQLKKANLIKSPFVFKMLVKKENLDRKLQAGTFKLSSSMSSLEIAQKLAGGADEIWVTLIEGWRTEEIADKLQNELNIKREDFLKVAKEGYMFPDTYLFPREFTAEQISKILRDNFNSKFSSELRSKIRSQGLSEDQGVILASIVEREGRSDKVRTEVASILLKRLKIGMGLNADATLQYALGYQKDEKSWWKRHLTNEDKLIGSPYNSYIHSGLPPTPICNPGLSSLQAVANADSSTPYLYYYHDSKGNSHYGKTLEEHNENVSSNP